MSVTALLFRFFAARSDKKRDRGLNAPEDICRFDDIQYGKSKRFQVLDVYRPKYEEGKVLPVIISVHGGGWVYGNKELYQYYCMSLARYGFAVVNFTYRLAPKYKHPAQLEDLNSVVKWIQTNWKKYGLNTDKVFLIGDSAGAHLAALYACLCTNHTFASQFPTVTIPCRFVPTALALNCGVYKIDGTKKNDRMTIALMKDLLGRNSENLYDVISPVLHITKAFPPVYLMTANRDFLKNQAPVMKEQLESAGILCEYHVFGTEEQPLSHVFHCNLWKAEARICNKEECMFFMRF